MELEEFREDFLQSVKADASASGEGSTAAFVKNMAEHLIDSEVLQDFQPAFYDQIGKGHKKLRIDGYIRDEIDGFIEFLDNTFGKGKMKECEEYLLRLKKLT